MSNCVFYENENETAAAAAEAVTSQLGW